MALVLDTGVIYGALATSDPQYTRCSKLLAESNETLIVPPLVLVEVEYFVRKFGTIPAWTTFIEDLEAGVYVLHGFDSPLLRSSTDLQERYSDQSIGLVDASVFVTCEQLGEDKSRPSITGTSASCELRRDGRCGCSPTSPNRRSKPRRV